ncbi:hypothetical protein K435DRAFT_856685 [Dendrothele bispora CBS 962.96]|uniref:Uncharacterized protein n=1 Tax=Dendrothele bispora (strain CBS 962.96) TaxID=1314807 RepID=A0A4S8M7Y0_DENBC|nr:hypothetical protein K435DRAFT_856685 [Dendrothele bispora CBS 962.96]
MPSPFVFSYWPDVQLVYIVNAASEMRFHAMPDHLKITRKLPSKAPEANLSISLPTPSTETTEEAIGDDALFCEEKEPGELDELMERRWSLHSNGL